MKKPGARWLTVAFAVVLAAAFSACSNPADEGYASDARGTPEVAPWDAAQLEGIAAGMNLATVHRVGRPERHPRRWRFDGEDLAHVWIDVNTVKVHGEATGWHTITPVDSDLDLLALADDLSPVGLNDLPADSYDSLRLVLGHDNRLEFKDGSRRSLLVPWGQFIGIRIFGHFDVQKDFSVHVALDFDPEKSIVVIYHGRRRPQNHYALLPLMRIQEVVQEPMGGENGGGETANQAPVAAFPTWSFTVLGAGTAAANGNYTENGTSLSRPKYDNDGGTFYLYSLDASEGSGLWVIHDALLGAGSSISGVVAYYNGDQTATTPPEDSWSIVAGAAPEPTLLRMPISGTLTATGFPLTAHYQYSDPDGDAEGTTTFQWYRFTDPNSTSGGTAIAGATGVSYTTGAADAGRYLRIEVTPQDAQGLAGAPVMSAATGVATAGS